MVYYFVISNNDGMNTIAFTSLWPCVLLLKDKFLTMKCKVCLFSDIDGCWKIASNDVSSVYTSVCGKGECCSPHCHIGLSSTFCQFQRWEFLLIVLLFFSYNTFSHISYIHIFVSLLRLTHSTSFHILLSFFYWVLICNALWELESLDFWSVLHITNILFSSWLSVTWCGLQYFFLC